jgi:hypothetical protein
MQRQELSCPQFSPSYLLPIFCCGSTILMTTPPAYYSCSVHGYIMGLLVLGNEFGALAMLQALLRAPIRSILF